MELTTRPQGRSDFAGDLNRLHRCQTPLVPPFVVGLLAFVRSRWNCAIIRPVALPATRPFVARIRKDATTRCTRVTKKKVSSMSHSRLRAWWVRSIKEIGMSTGAASTSSHYN